MAGPEGKTVRDEGRRLPVDEDDDARPLHVYADRYVIERELGRGGMGRVFVARDRRLSRAVALKLLPPSATRRSSVRIVTRELKSAQARVAALQHLH